VFHGPLFVLMTIYSRDLLYGTGCHVPDVEVAASSAKEDAGVVR
jgi:hypothetical protein